MPTALLSAFDKTGVPEFAAELHRLGWNILASGGTAKCIVEAGITVTDIATIVGEPILGHRVVTLSREIHAALLSKDTPEDNAELERIGMPRIDLVYVNLYPLEQELAKPDRTLDSVVEMVDVGGPAMLMAALKGQRFVMCERGQISLIKACLHGTIPPDELKVSFRTTAIRLLRQYYKPLEEFLQEQFDELAQGPVRSTGTVTES